MSTPRNRSAIGEGDVLGRFRDDVAIEGFERGGQPGFRLLSPGGFAFELYELEYRVARALDGRSSAVEICRQLAASKFAVTTKHVLSFYRELHGMGFVEAAWTSPATAPESDATAPMAREPVMSAPQPSASAQMTSHWQRPGHRSDTELDWQDADADDVAATVVDPFAVDGLARDLGALLPGRRAESAAEATERRHTPHPATAEPLAAATPPRPAKLPATPEPLVAATQPWSPVPAPADATVAEPMYPRFESPQPGNYPRLAPTTGAPPLPAVAPMAPTGFALGTEPAGPQAPAYPSLSDLPPSASSIAGARLASRYPRRVLAIAVCGGAALVGAAFLVVALGDDATAPADAPSYDAAPVAAAVVAPPTVTVSRAEQLEHPRATMMSPVDGEVVASELKAARQVAAGERLFVIRQKFDGTGKSGRLLLRAPFAASATPRIRKGATVTAGRLLAELVDDSSWQLMVTAAGAPVTTRTPCRLRVSGGASEASCTIAEVEDDQAGGVRLTVRFAVADAPWLDGRIPDILLSP